MKAPSKSTAKLVAFCLSTYMDRSGRAYPGKPALSRGTSLSERSVDDAIDHLEVEGYLHVTRSKGGNSRTNTYQATFPAGQVVPRFDASRGTSTGHLTTANGATDAPNRAGGAPESVESAESGALYATNAQKGAAAPRCPECRTGDGFHADGCSKAAA